MHTPQQIHISDYAYALPDDRIAKYPLAERDASKLLIYRGGQIRETLFRHLHCLSSTTPGSFGPAYCSVRTPAP